MNNAHAGGRKLTISDTIQKAIDCITSTFNNSEDGIYEEMMNDERDYQVVDNMAIQPGYSHSEQKQKNSKTVDINRYRGYEVMVCEPASYEDAMSIVKHLKDRKTVVLKLDMLDKENSLRIVDFLCGATHALGGSQQKIGESVFIFTPVNVSLSADSQKSKFMKDALWSQPQI